MTDLKASVARIAASLKVSNKTGDDAWSHWTLVHNPDSQGGPYTYSQTWVVQGPCSVIVAGDMGSMVFERAGGLGLQFARGSMDYVDEKCAAGEVWEYDGDIALREFVAHMEELIAEVDPLEDNDDECLRLRRLIDEAEYEVNFHNEGHLGQWYHDNVCCDDAPPDFGRVPSNAVKRALACIDAVWAYEQANT